MQQKPAKNSQGAAMIKEPKLLDRLKEKIRLKHYSIITEKAYWDWNRRFILFHN